MPTMPRPKSKATKIAYNVLGIPDNLKSKRSKKQKKINKELVFQETTRVR